MSLTSAPQSCPVCAVPPTSTLRLRNGAPLLRCSRCGLGWWPWDAFDPAGFYDADYFQSETAPQGYNDYRSMEPGIRRTARARLRRLARLKPGGPGRLLDLGCGTGVFLDEARRAGWDVAGVEVSAYGVEEARRRGLAVERATADEAELAPGSFDCVTLWDVIEHVGDPRRVLRVAAAALRPGGILALSTGDVTSLCARVSGAAWHLFTLPEHLFFFSPASLRLLMGQVGLRVVNVTREVNWVPLAYIVERLSKSLRLPAWPRRLPGTGWSVPATLFDVLGVYAVRRGAHEHE